MGIYFEAIPAVRFIFCFLDCFVPRNDKKAKGCRCHQG